MIECRFYAIFIGIKRDAMHTKGKFVLILLIMIHSIGNACSSGEKRVRMPAVAGAFYPAKADTLRKMIASFMSDASSVEPDKEVQAVIVPHAGYVYSGASFGERCFR